MLVIVFYSEMHQNTKLKVIKILKSAMGGQYCIENVIDTKTILNSSLCRFIFILCKINLVYYIPSMNFLLFCSEINLVS